MKAVSSHPWLILQAARDKYASKNIEMYQESAKRLIKFRGWDATVEEVAPVLKEADVFFIPSGILEEPGFGFPINEPECCFMTLLHVRYLRPLMPIGIKAKTIGFKNAMAGPSWFGMDKKTLNQIITQKSVLIVEGPMDLIACRVILGPNIPVLSVLGRTISRRHELDLHLLGVESVYSMWDQDAAGRSAKIPDSISRKVYLRCPSNDPSDCLKSLQLAKQLHREVNLVFPGTDSLQTYETCNKIQPKPVSSYKS